MFKYEMIKIWRKKSFLILLSASLLLNLFILWYNHSNIQEHNIMLQSYQLLQLDLEGLSHQEKKQFLTHAYEHWYMYDIMEQITMYEANDNEISQNMASQLRKEHQDQIDKYDKTAMQLTYTTDASLEFIFISEIYEQFVKVDQYQEYVKQIMDNAAILKQVSIFQQEDSYANKNIRTIAKAYEAMQGVTIDFQLSKGLENFTEASWTTDIILIMILFFLAGHIITEEREKGLLPLIKSTANGRYKTMFTKLCTLTFSTVVIVICFYVCNYLYYSYTAGMGNIHSSIQSTALLMESTLPLSIMQYLILFIALKVMSLLIIALLAVWLAINSKYQGIVYVSFILILAISTILYVSISVHSNINILKYINIISFLMPNGILKKYFTIRFFNQPIAGTTLSYTIALLLIIVLTLSCLYSFGQKKDMQVKQFPLKNRISFIKQDSLYTKLSVFEIYKLFINHKMLMVTILLFSYQFQTIRQSNRYLFMDEVLYQQYMLILEGELTDEKENYILEQVQTFEKAQQRVEDIHLLVQSGSLSKEEADNLLKEPHDTLSTQEIFMRVIEQYDYIKENPDSQFVYDTGYKYLTATRINLDIVWHLLAFVVIIYGLSLLFTAEYQTGMITIIAATPRGRKDTVSKKIMAAFILVFIIYVATQLMNIIIINTFYGMNQLLAPMGSVSAWREIAWPIPIIGFLLLFYLSRCIAFLFIGTTILWLSIKLKKQLLTLLSISIVLLIPYIFYMMGFTFMYYVSVIPLLDIQYLAQTKPYLIILYWLIACTSGAYFLRAIYRQFGYQTPHKTFFNTSSFKKILKK